MLTWPPGENRNHQIGKPSSSIYQGTVHLLLNPCSELHSIVINEILHQKPCAFSLLNSIYNLYHLFLLYCIKHALEFPILKKQNQIKLLCPQIQLELSPHFLAPFTAKFLESIVHSYYLYILTSHLSSLHPSGPH